MAARRVGYTVRQMRSGRWQVMVTDAAGNRVGLGTYADKAKAEEAGQLEAVRMRAGTWVDPRMADIPVEEYVDAWLDRRRRTGRHGERYAEDGRRMLRLHIKPTLGRVLLTDLSPPVISRWYDDLVAKQLAANQAKADAVKKAGGTPPVRVTEGLVPAKTYRLLHAALQDAVRDQLIVTNPCMIPGAGVERSPERPLIEPEQVLELAEAVRPRWRAMVLLAGWCAMSFGELAGLRRSGVDMLHGTLRVERAVGETASGRLFEKDPKTAARRRTVAIPEPLLPALRLHLEEFVDPDPMARVFTSPRGGPLRRSSFGDEFAAAVTAAGLAGVTFHDLRHAGGTLAAQLGATERELQARLGHASPAAARRYQHAAERRNRELSDRIGAAFVEVAEKRAAEAAAKAEVGNLRAHVARKGGRPKQK